MNVSRWLAAGSLLATIDSTPALAQESDNSAAAQGDVAPVDTADADGEVLVVTAQLREQNAIDVPIALTAYSGEFLDELGLDDFEELSRFVPGFDVQNQSPDNPGFSIRGITSDSGQALTSRACRSTRTASPSPSRAAPMSNSSTSSVSRSRAGRNRHCTAAAR